MAHNRTRDVLIGSFITAGSIGMLFWWGVHFNVFGSKIDWLGRPEQIGFLVWMIIGAFGAGYMAGGVRLGIKGASFAAVLLIGAAVFGAIRGMVAG